MPGFLCALQFFIFQVKGQFKEHFYTVLLKGSVDGEEMIYKDMSKLFHRQINTLIINSVSVRGRKRTYSSRFMKAGFFFFFKVVY